MSDELTAERLGPVTGIEQDPANNKACFTVGGRKVWCFITKKDGDRTQAYSELISALSSGVPVLVKGNEYKSADKPNPSFTGKYVEVLEKDLYEEIASKNKASVEIGAGGSLKGKGADSRSTPFDRTPEIVASWALDKFLQLKAHQWREGTAEAKLAALPLVEGAVALIDIRDQIVERISQIVPAPSEETPAPEDNVASFD